MYMAIDAVKRFDGKTEKYIDGFSLDNSPLS